MPRPDSRCRRPGLRREWLRLHHHRRIAREAGESEGTIYNYFESKADLLVGLIARLSALEHLDTELLQGLEGDLREFLTGMFRQRTARMEGGQEILQAILPEILVSPELQERFGRLYVRQVDSVLEQAVHAMIDMGRMRPVNVTLTIRLIQAMFVGLLVLRAVGDETIEAQWDGLPETIATLLFDGLGPTAG